MTRRDLLRNAALALPLLLVNAAAVYGQAGWAYDHLHRGLTLACLFALAVESIGVYLAVEAHAALMADHAAGLLRFGSYAVGALIGFLNFSHFAGSDLAPNALALTFGLLSAISPWLWAIRSRSINRARLATMGLIDPRAVKFSRLRWSLFPVRTFTAFRGAVWAGVQEPAAAISLADARRAERREARQAATPPRHGDTPPPAAATLAVRPALSDGVRPRPLPSRRTPAVASSATRDEARRRFRDGAAPRVIATELGVSKRTVERHVADLRVNGHDLTATETVP